ncbi:hypothetical protein [Roseicyclus sp.]|uniref:hypothetical protein n=1 Tax=Roseicyclus sp. TaxID=1914329 RepID=UPI003F6BF694
MVRIIAGSEGRFGARRLACLISGFGIVALLAACGGEFDRGPRGAGLPYDARLSTGETWRDFTILVRAPGVSLADARESARFVATRHCIERTGASSVDWVIDSATGDWFVTRNDAGEPMIAGRCSAR